MLKLTRLLVLISIAVLVARPVMACCLAGHGAPAPPQVQAETQPCHGALSAGHPDRVGTDHRPAPPMDCPGCFDCETAIIQAQALDGSGVLAQAPSDVALAILVSRFAGFEPAPTVFKTGPPADPLLSPRTLVDLKQHLLI